MTKNQMIERDRWQSDPTQPEVYRAYNAPQSPEHWSRISELVLTGGFTVSEVIPATNSQEQTEKTNTEYRVSWPSQELENLDYKLFLEVSRMVIGTLHLDDTTYTATVLPKIFEQLEQSYLFQLLFQKVSNSQGNTVQHHVETVPQLIDTSGCDLRERFILRMTAIFHDTGKAFNIGRDQLHYHALIGSDILDRFLTKHSEQLMTYLLQFEHRAGQSVISSPGEKKKLTRTEVKEFFLQLKLEVTELIRLHHVLEQIDKGVLDLKTVAEIFVSQKINTLLSGLFIVADGGSVIPDNEKYRIFLIQNLRRYVQVMETLRELQATHKLQQNQKSSSEILAIIQEAAYIFDPILAVALLDEFELQKS